MRSEEGTKAYRGKERLDTRSLASFANLVLGAGVKIEKDRHRGTEVHVPHQDFIKTKHKASKTVS